MGGVHGVQRRWIATLLAGLCGATASCADPDFRADAEDARRLDLLRSDRLSVYLGAPDRCTETMAVFVPSDGHPLSFDAVEDNVIRCSQPASGEGIAGVLAAAEEAGWSPAVDGGRFELSKQFGDLWATARFLTGSTSFDVEVTFPPHTREGDPPVPAQLAQGRTCADAVRARQPPAPDCGLPAP